MGYTNEDEEAGPSTPELEETLPLYDESQRDAAAKIELPDQNATPDEVRDFIVQVLQARGVAVDRARRVAARWELGTGEELRSYPVAMFRDIFGVEDAWVVYKETKILLYRKEAEEALKTRNAGFVLTAILLCFWILAIVVFNLSNTAWVNVVCFVVMVFGGMAILVSSVALCITTKPEDRVANELKSQWQKPTATQNGAN